MTSELPFSEPDNVLTFVPRDECEPEPVISRVPSWTTLDTCKHRRFSLDVKARTVSCHTCGVALDPIGVLNTLATDWQRIKNQYTALEDYYAKIDARREKDLQRRANRARKAP